MHNPRCPLAPERLNEAVSDWKLPPGAEGQAKLIALFAAALLEDLVLTPIDRSGLMLSPKQAHSYQSATPMQVGLLEPITGNETDPLAKNKVMLGYFGGLLCSKSVEEWEASRDSNPALSWEVTNPDARQVFGNPFGKTVGLRPFDPWGHAKLGERRTPKESRTISRAWAIHAMSNLCGFKISEAIARLRKERPRLFFPKDYNRESFKTDRSNICKMYPSEHEAARPVKP